MDFNNIKDIAQYGRDIIKLNDRVEANEAAVVTLSEQFYDLNKYVIELVHRVKANESDHDKDMEIIMLRLENRLKDFELALLKNGYAANSHNDQTQNGAAGQIEEAPFTSLTSSSEPE